MNSQIIKNHLVSVAVGVVAGHIYGLINVLLPEAQRWGKSEWIIYAVLGGGACVLWFIQRSLKWTALFFFFVGMFIALPISQALYHSFGLT